MDTIGAINPELKARIDRIHKVINDLVENHGDNIPQDVWDAITRKLYELVEMV